jgi:hypothetical protein
MIPRRTSSTKDKSVRPVIKVKRFCHMAFRLSAKASVFCFKAGFYEIEVPNKTVIFIEVLRLGLNRKNRRKGVNCIRLKV